MNIAIKGLITTVMPGDEYVGIIAFDHQSFRFKFTLEAPLSYFVTSIKGWKVGIKTDELRKKFVLETRDVRGSLVRLSDDEFAFVAAILAILAPVEGELQIDLEVPLTVVPQRFTISIASAA